MVWNWGRMLQPEFFLAIMLRSNIILLLKGSTLLPNVFWVHTRCWLFICNALCCLWSGPFQLLKTLREALLCILPAPEIYLATIAEWPFLLQELPHLLPAEPPIWPFRSGALSKSEVGLWIVISSVAFTVSLLCPSAFLLWFTVREIQWYLGTTLSSLC